MTAPTVTFFIDETIDIITLRASEAATQCTAIAPVCLWAGVCLWICYHDNSKLRGSILTKLGL